MTIVRVKRRHLVGYVTFFIIFGKNIRFILRFLGVDGLCINFFGASVVNFVLCCDKRADGDRLGLILFLVRKWRRFPSYLTTWTRTTTVLLL